MNERRFEVDDLIIRVLSEAASPFEVERLNRWREESPENEEQYQETLRVWALTAPEPVVPASGPPAVEAVMAAAQDLPIPIQEHGPRSAPAWRRWALLAASVAALALGIRAMVPAGPSPLAVYEASGDRSLTVTLEDGSFVRLAQGSRLTEWAAESGREVALEGKAFFAVARDEQRPFRVRTDGGQVRVLGTRFEVSQEDDDVRTVVVEGRVEVSNERGTVEVASGEVAWIEGSGAPRTETPEDLYALLSWEEGILVFHASPLTQVAAEVQRHYGRPLTIADDDLAVRRITAWFQGEPFEEVAESLCLAAGADCRVADGGVTMDMGEGS